MQEFAGVAVERCDFPFVAMHSSYRSLLRGRFARNLTSQRASP